MASFKKCIEQHCKNCTYDSSQPGSWRQQTQNCSVTSCALWPVRPVTMETVSSGRIKGNKIIPIGVDLDGLIDGLEDEDDEITDKLAA